MKQPINLSGTYGKMDNLTLTYNGNRLTGVSEATADYDFAGSFEYKRANGSQYLYNANGSLIADKSRGIAYITYAPNGTPQKIYFTNGNVTKYRYSATGQKLSVEYYVAAPNVTVPFGTEPDALTQSQTMYAGSRQYLLGGSLVMEDGMIDKFLFNGGYASASMTSPTTYTFSFYYYNQDHLGNNREVVDSAGTVKQITHYYPFGTPYADPSTILNPSLQPYKYNGKELDRMHGLDTYDYGARQYNPVTARWDRMDPLCEKYYSVSPYAYCGNNPVRFIDSDGLEWKDINGNIIINHDQIKVYIFYDKDAFSNQSQAMYREAERTYGKGSVALSDAMTIESFEEDWKNMASNSIAEVNLNYHGNNQTLYLDASKNQYLTATGNGFTNSQPQSRRVAAGNVQELPIPIGNISHTQLNINSCKSNSTTQKPLLGSKKTLMKVFAESFDFQAVRGSSVGVSYGRLDLLPHPQYFTREGWFKNWEYIGKPIRRPATSPVFRYNDALYFRTGGMK